MNITCNFGATSPTAAAQKVIEEVSKQGMVLFDLLADTCILGFNVLWRPILIQFVFGQLSKGRHFTSLQIYFLFTILTHFNLTRNLLSFTVSLCLPFLTVKKCRFDFPNFCNVYV